MSCGCQGLAGFKSPEEADQFKAMLVGVSDDQLRELYEVAAREQDRERVIYILDEAKRRGISLTSSIWSNWWLWAAVGVGVYAWKSRRDFFS